MESVTHKSRENDAKQAALRAQIAALQAQLVTDTPPPEPKDKGKRKAEQQSAPVLAQSTPSPKKRKINRDKPPYASSTSSTTALKPTRPLLNPLRLNKPSVSTSGTKAAPAPSALVNKLAALSKPSAAPAAPTRSAAFVEPAPFPDALPIARGHPTPDAPARDDNLALIETLEPEPTREHRPPHGDPDFKTLEPHSGIRLATRTLAHSDLAEHLCGRFLLPPSLLYSIVRVAPHKAGYDVPVPGDWVTIAVVAERGPIRQSKAPVTLDKDQGAEGDEDEEGLGVDLGAGGIQIKDRGGKGRKGGVVEKRRGKKYVSLKLVDFGARGAASSNGKAVIRGDGMLTLLLFEADAVEEGVDDEGRRERTYRGGSRGAFEKMAKLKEGAVVALLNPRVLKPFNKANAAAADNVLALTPESAESVAVIGTARDLGMCQVARRDGRVCGGWVDKRVSEVCEWHVQTAVKARRSGRAEFSIGTSGLTSSAVRTRHPKTEYDPRRQWGLKPEAGEGASATYVVSGHVVSGSGAKGMFVEEQLGREVQAKAARVSKSKEEERTLKMLLGRDREGMRVVVAAREAKERMEGKEKGKGKAKVKEKKESESEEEGEGEVKEKRERRGYSSSMVKQLGFDPTGRSGRGQQKGVEDKLNMLSALRSAKGPVDDKDLALRPGKRRSGVSKPRVSAASTPASTVSTPAPAEVNLDTDSEDERAEAPRKWSVADLGSDEDDLGLDFPDSDEEKMEDGFGRPDGLLEGDADGGDSDVGMVDLDSED